MKYIFLLCFQLTLTAAFAQTQEEIIRQDLMNREEAQKAEVARTLDRAVELMENEEYEVAEDKFREVLKKSKVVPTNLTFFFGKNSFYLGKYKQSIDWLNKYLELKGTSGRYYEECTQLLKLANQSYLALRKDEQEKAAQILTSNYEVDCGPTGKVTCPVCKGRGVIIEPGAFGNVYKTCAYSDKHGQLTCAEYNQLLRGELRPKF